MKKTGIALLCAMGLLFCGGNTLAAEAYTETSLPFAKSAHETFGKMALSAGDDGAVAYVYGGRERTARDLGWYDSEDGGKSWREKDTSWYGPIAAQAQKQIEAENDAIQKKWGGAYQVDPTDAGSVGSMLLTDDGTLYCMINVGKKAFRYRTPENANKGYSSYDVLQIFKAADGKAAVIPNLELRECDVVTENDAIDDLDYREYHLVSAGTDGKIYVRMDARSMGGVGEVTSRFQIYDEKTGKLLSETKPLALGNAPDFCGVGNTAYLLQSKPEGLTLYAYDMETGEQTRSVPLPGAGQGSYASSICASSGGTVYVTASSGLYRLAPGADAFAKLLDGASCRLGEDAKCIQPSCTESGAVYVPILRYEGLKKPGQGKLFRYESK